MSNPYTIRDPHHSSRYVQVQRRSKCKGCNPEDPTGASPYLPHGIIERGELAVRVTINSGPSERNQTFHEECYFKVRNACIAAYLSDAWKVQPEQRMTVVREEEPKIEADFEIDYEAHFAADDIPF